MEQFRSQLHDCLGDEITLKSQKQLADISTMWVAHPLILKVKKHLKTFGINAMLGVEWLSEVKIKEQEKLALVEKMRQMQDYHTMFKALPDLTARLADMEKEIAAAELQDKVIDRDKDALQGKSEEITKMISEVTARKRELDRDSGLCEGSEPIAPDDMEANYDGILSRLIALNDLLAKRYQDIESLRREFDRISQQMNDENSLIGRFFQQPFPELHDLTREEVFSCARRVEDHENGELELKINAAAIKAHEISKEFSRITNDLARAETRLEILTKKILEAYKEQDGIYTGYTQESHESEKQHWFTEVQRLTLAYAASARELEKLEDRLKALYGAKTEIEDHDGVPPPPSNPLQTLDEEDTPMLASNPIGWVRKICRSINDARLEEERSRNDTLNKHKGFIKALNETKNPRLAEFVRGVESLEWNGKIFDREWMQSAIGGIAQKIQAFKAQTGQRIAELCKEKTEIILQLVARAEEFRKRILELAALTTINLHEEDIRLVEIKLETPDAQTAHDRMVRHVDKMVEHLSQLDRCGATADEKQSYVTESIGNKAALNVISPLELASVALLKLAQQSAFRLGKPVYTDWSNLGMWSMGEQFSAHMTVFLMLTGYIKSTASSRNTWQAVIVDNPFGAASSPHVLDPVFALAESLRIQLISCTDHKDESILRRFPSRYSLKLVPFSGKDYLTVHRMETLYGFAVLEDEDDQFSLSQEIMPALRQREKEYEVDSQL